MILILNSSSISYVDYNEGVTSISRLSQFDKLFSKDINMINYNYQSISYACDNLFLFDKLNKKILQYDNEGIFVSDHIEYNFKNVDLHHFKILKCEGMI